MRSHRARQAAAGRADGAPRDRLAVRADALLRVAVLGRRTGRGRGRIGRLHERVAAGGRAARGRGGDGGERGTTSAAGGTRTSVHAANKTRSPG